METTGSLPVLQEIPAAEAHRARHALIGSLAGAGARMVARLAASATRFVLGLRPGLPSLEETLAARVFLRCRQ